MISRAAGIIMTIMDVCKKHEEFIKRELEDMRNVETSNGFSNLRERYTIHYTKIIMTKFTTMILDGCICTSIGNKMPASDYRSIVESLSNIDRSDLHDVNDEWMSVLKTHIPDSLQDGIRNIWENSSSARNSVDASTGLLDIIYPYFSKDEKEVFSNIYSKYIKILSGEYLYDLIEEEGSC